MACMGFSAHLTGRFMHGPTSAGANHSASGAAAMLLAQGEKGKRFCLPNASIMLHQPRSQARGQASDIAIRAKEVMANRKVSCELLAPGPAAGPSTRL